MYDYLDRPVASLEAGEGLLLDGFRTWALARTWQRDPVEALAARLPRLQHRDALDTIDAVMTALDGGSTAALVLQRPCHTTVDDDEAVLLAVAAQVRDGRPVAAAATLALLVDARAADRIALLLTEAWARLDAPANADRPLR